MTEQPEAGPFKLICPICRGAFTGRLPARAAKGACPLCKKELVLLPDGKIQAGMDFRAVPAPVSEEEIEPGTGKAVLSFLLFLMPAAILAICATITLPDKTHDMFHRIGERAENGLLRMQEKIRGGKEEIRTPTRRTPTRS